MREALHVCSFNYDGQYQGLDVWDGFTSTVSRFFFIAATAETLWHEHIGRTYHMTEHTKEAIFAFDYTLVNRDVTTMFLKYFCRNRAAYYLRSLPLSIAYALGIYSKNKYAKLLISTFLKNKSHEEIVAAAVRFLPQINALVNGKSIQELQARRLEGYDIILKSYCLKEIIEPWALQYGITNIIANELEYDLDGISTGYVYTK